MFLRCSLRILSSLILFYSASKSVAIETNRTSAAIYFEDPSHTSNMTCTRLYNQKEICVDKKQIITFYILWRTSYRFFESLYNFSSKDVKSISICSTNAMDRISNTESYINQNFAEVVYKVLELYGCVSFNYIKNMTSLHPLINHQKAIKIAIVSVCVSSKRFDDEYIMLSFKNKQSYCNKWNLTCFFYKEQQQTTNENFKPNLKWEKLLRLNEVLLNYEIDFVMWMDCDTMFTNYLIEWSTQIKKYVPIYDKPSLICSKDKNGINLGVFLLQGGIHGRIILSTMLLFKEDIDKRLKSPIKDQLALQMARKYLPPSYVNIQYINQKYINAFVGNNDGYKWQEGDWIAHQVNCNREACPTIFKSMLKKYTV